MPALIKSGDLPGLTVGQPRSGVTLITINRPARSNALDEAILLALPDLLASLAEDDSTRAVVLSGAGACFSAGGDLDVIRSVASSPPDWTERFLEEVMRSSLALYDLPKPTIAAVNGPVAGGALGLALACDIRLASATATFSASFIHMGLLPDLGASWLLPRVMGPGPALEFLVAGRRVEAVEAQQLGLVSRLCEDPLESALDLASVMASMPPQATVATKRMLREALEVDFDAALLLEARHQTAAMNGPEFADRYGAWRTAVTGS